MESQAALGGADGSGELHPVAPVDLNLALVVHPGYPEEKAALRLHQALDDAHVGQLGLAVKDGLQRGEDLLHGLEKFFLLTVTVGHVLIDIVQIRVLDCHE
mgnify:CR=1 FL=1